MKCEFCGSVISEEAIKCESCGAPVLLPELGMVKDIPLVKKVDQRDLFIQSFPITNYTPEQNSTVETQKTSIRNATFHDVIANIVLPVLFAIDAYYCCIFIMKKSWLDTLLFGGLSLAYLLCFYLIRKKNSKGITYAIITCSLDIAYKVFILIISKGNTDSSRLFIGTLVFALPVIYYYRNNKNVFTLGIETTDHIINSYQEKDIESENYLKGIVNNAICNNTQLYSDALKEKINSLSNEQLEQIRDLYFSRTTQEILIAAKKKYRGSGFDEKLSQIIRSESAFPFDKYGKDKKYAGYIYAVLCRIYNINYTDTLCFAINNKQIRLLNNEVAKLINKPIEQGAPYEKLLEQKSVANIENIHHEDSFWKKELLAIGTWELLYFLSFVLNALVVTQNVTSPLFGYLILALYYCSISLSLKKAPNDKRSNYIAVCMGIIIYLEFVFTHPNASMTTSSLVMGICMVAIMGNWKRVKNG